MKKQEKQETMERIVEKFLKLEDSKAKSYAVLCMTAYAAGVEAGRQEKREKETA